MSQRIADFGPLIEAEAAHDPVGQADRNEAVLELAGLELGADQDRAILRPAAAGDMRLDPFADEAGLFRAVPHAHDADFFAGLSLGPQGLAEPAAIVRNHAAGRTENVRRRAGVLLPPDYGCARKILFEPQDVRSEENTFELQALMRH